MTPIKEKFNFTNNEVEEWNDDFKTRRAARRIGMQLNESFPRTSRAYMGQDVRVSQPIKFEGLGDKTILTDLVIMQIPDWLAEHAESASVKLGPGPEDKTQWSVLSILLAPINSWTAYHDYIEQEKYLIGFADAWANENNRKNQNAYSVAIYDQNRFSLRYKETPPYKDSHIIALFQETINHNKKRQIYGWIDCSGLHRTDRLVTLGNKTFISYDQKDN